MIFSVPLLLLALVSACLAIPVSFGISEYNFLFGLEKPLKKLDLADQIVGVYIKSK
jgi:hypothetical protein